MNHKYSFSGLAANLFPFIKSGMQQLAKRTDADFHSLLFGYLGWRKLANKMVDAYIKGEVKQPYVLMGHSNGVYASLKIAEYLNKYKVPCVVVSVDKTLKWCPPAGKNVKGLQDHHAKLSRVKMGPDFAGVYETFEYPTPKGFFGSWHIGVSSDTILHDRVVAWLEKNKWL